MKVIMTVNITCGPVVVFAVVEFLLRVPKVEAGVNPVIYSEDGGKNEL